MNLSGVVTSLTKELLFELRSLCLTILGILLDLRELFVELLFLLVVSLDVYLVLTLFVFLDCFDFV